MKRRSVGTPKLMKALNRESILYFVQEHEPISQADISRELEMSRATVSTIVRELVDEGMLTEAGKADAVIGRRPTLLELNAAACTAVVADLSQSQPAVAVVDLRGRIVHRAVGRDLRRLYGEAALREFLRFVERVAREAESRTRRVCGIGIAVPGITATTSGVVRSSAGLGWHNVELAQLVSERTNLPTRIDNDVNLAAQGEMWKGAAKGVRNLVMIQVGDGIGAAIVIDGHVYRGANDAAGEIGHMILDDSRLGEDFTEWGWLEVQASERFADKQVAEKQATGNLAETEHDDRTMTVTAMKWVLMAICNIIACLNPDLCLVGGTLIKDGTFDTERAARLVKRTIPVACRVEYGALGSDAALIGAAADIFQSQRLVKI